MKKHESESKISCITNHDGFESVCLNLWVLQTAHFTYRHHYGNCEEREKSLSKKVNHATCTHVSFPADETVSLHIASWIVDVGVGLAGE